MGWSHGTSPRLTTKLCPRLPGRLGKYACLQQKPIISKEFGKTYHPEYILLENTFITHLPLRFPEAKFTYFIVSSISSIFRCI
jgi:hypothetical protein